MIAVSAQIDIALQEHACQAAGEHKMHQQQMPVDNTGMQNVPADAFVPLCVAAQWYRLGQ